MHACKVLYLFAGSSRQSDVGSWVQRLWPARVSALSQPPTVTVVSLDLLRDPIAHDLLDDGLQQKTLAEISTRVYEAVIAAPPCNTYSRALWKDNRGPRRLRDRHSPWGFAGLTGADLTKCQEAYTLMQFTARVAAAAATADVGFLLEFPEDLGSTAQGTPASLW